MPNLEDYMIATRNDGREFEGYVQNIRQTVKGTLILLRVADETTHSGWGYKSFYMENVTEWDSNASPEYMFSVYN